MQPEQHPAAELIDEARFMRRMAKVVEVSAEAVEMLAASVRPAQPAGPMRLEVPTLNAEGWTPAVLYVVRGERAKATPLAGIVAMLGWMFNVEVTPQVLLAAVMHFDLDRREDAPAPAELQVPCDGMTGAEWLVKQEAVSAPVYAPPSQSFAGTAVEMASRIAAPNPGEMPVGDLQAAPAAPIGPNPEDPCAAEPWAEKALAMHAEGDAPFAIARALKMYGATDFKVRCLIIPGFRQQQRDKINAARGFTTRPAVADQAKEDARLRELREVRGKEFREIAAIMKNEGFTPRTVGGWIGRANRLGISVPVKRPQPSMPKVNPPKPAPRPREPETKPQPKPARRGVSNASPTVLPWSIPEKEPTLATDIPAEGAGVALLDLTFESCRWPIGASPDGQQTYCGCPKSRHGSSYCDVHAKRAFAEWPPRTPIKRPTRMARSMSALPDAPARQPERTV